jgi:glycosyltransferase involved in cell wall biosynthesis
MSEPVQTAQAVQVSVIVPTRLRTRLLARAVQSILHQTFKDFEIIVVDDNPPQARLRDDPELTDLFSDGRIRVLEHDTPRNAASARNVALRVARGRWVTFLDDDDSYRHAKLEKQIEAAVRTELPIGLCGVEFQLARRSRQVQVSSALYKRADFLTLFQALPTLWHENTHGQILFREDLDAGEDAYYFHCIIKHFRAVEIFNVPLPLVDVYPQAGPRVNTNAEGSWRAAQAIWQDFAADYSAAEARAFMVRSRIGYLKRQERWLGEMAGLSYELVRLRGLRDWRFIANSWLYRVPWMRRFLVS